MRKQIYWIAFICVHIFSGGCVIVFRSQPIRKIRCEKVGQIPDGKKIESSGLAAEDSDRGTYWTHGDAGSEAVIYRIDSAGRILQTVPVSGAVNTDWEDMTTDSAGNLYVGDFGNYSGTRKDLRIIGLGNVGITDSACLTRKIMSFSFPSSCIQPISPLKNDFDCEAFFRKGEKFYLISKNRGTAWTKLYSLEITSDSMAEVLRLSDSLRTRFIPFPLRCITGIITGADLSPSRNKIALLSYGVVIILSDFSGDSFFRGGISKMNIRFSQTEGICFTGENELLISNENGKLFRLLLKERKREKYKKS